MMRIKCPKCKTVLSIDDSLAGTVVACSGCSAKIRAPAAKPPLKAPPQAVTKKVEQPKKPPPLKDTETIKPGKPLPRRKPPWPEPAEEVEIIPEDEDSDGSQGKREDADRVEFGRFHPRPYVPEGGVTLYGLPVLLGMVLVTGVVLGVLAAFIGQWFYLVGLMPVVLGFGVYGAGWLGVKLGKVRNRWLGAAAGFGGGTALMLTFHYWLYLNAVLTVPQLAPLDKTILAVSPVSFLRFVDARARDGVRLIGTRAGANETNLGHVGSYLYWFSEFVLVAGIGLAGTLIAASQPFCGRCRNWKQPRELGTIHAPAAEVIAALRSGDMELLAACGPGPFQEELLLTVAVCPSCEKRSDIDVKLERVTVTNQGWKKKKELVHLTYPGKALAAFEQLFAPAAA